MVFGHVTGFFAYLALEGKAPEKTGNDEAYSAPARGMLLELYNTGAASLYDPTESSPFTRATNDVRF